VNPTLRGRRTRYLILGVGGRAGAYLDAILGAQADVAQLVAIGDTNKGRADRAAAIAATRLSNDRPPVTFAPDDLEDVIAREGVERVIVTSPDFSHADFIARSLRAGADVIVEKPLTIDEAGCRTINAAMAATDRVVTVTFNYRYSPRNSALKSLLLAGEIGQVTAVHFEWLLDTAHGADYFRRWHRDKANSGGLLIHKASHHFDLVNWWLDDIPERVFASGGLRFYGASNARARGIGGRPDRGSVGPHSDDPFVLDMRDNAQLRELYLDNEVYDGYLRDRDVFDEGITIEDNLSLVVDYARGTSMSYSLNAHSPWEGYRIGLTGTTGRIELEVVERSAVELDPAAERVVDPSTGEAPIAGDDLRPIGHRLLVQPMWGRAREAAIEEGFGSHGGGDAKLMSDLFRGHSDDPLGRPAGVLDGLRAVAVGIAGNRSLETGLAVKIDDLDLGRSLGSGAIGR
jgi:predicted dehydrogenase